MSVVVLTKPSFKDRLQTLRVQHAVVQGGQQILLFVFTTLFLGEDLHDIKGFLERHLGSKRQYKDSFTKPEQEKLDEGDHRNWDISLIFKLLQKVCGLNQKVGDWKRFGKDTLEKLLDDLKDLRNEMAHNFDCVLSEKQRDEKLEELRNLCLEILTKLNEMAQIGTDVVHHHYESIEYILNDVKKPINESSNGSFQCASTAGSLSKNALSSPASPASASIGLASASASANYAKSAYAAASTNSAIVEGFRAAAVCESDYYHDSVEAMDVDDSIDLTSGDNSIINQLVKSFWKFAGPGFITV